LPDRSFSFYLAKQIINYFESTETAMHPKLLWGSSSKSVLLPAPANEDSGHCGSHPTWLELIPTNTSKPPHYLGEQCRKQA
jgi:hypothetical protein